MSSPPPPPTTLTAFSFCPVGKKRSEQTHPAREVRSCPYPPLPGGLSNGPAVLMSRDRKRKTASSRRNGLSFPRPHVSSSLRCPRWMRTALFSRNWKMGKKRQTKGDGSPTSTFLAGPQLQLHRQDISRDVAENHPGRLMSSD